MSSEENLCLSHRSKPKLIFFLSCKNTTNTNNTDEEEIEEKAEERRRKGQDPDWDVILNRTAASPLMVR